VYRGRLTVLAVIGLLACGTLAVMWRYQSRHIERLNTGDTAWRLTYVIECEAERGAAELRIASPADTRHCRVFRQDFRQQNLRLDPRGRSSSQAREIVALAEEPGACESTLRFDLRLNQRAAWETNGAPVVLTANQRAEYLQATSDIQVKDASVVTTLAVLRDAKVDELTLIRRIFRHLRQDIVVAPDGEAADDASAVLEDGRGTAIGCVRAMIALCRAATIPARPVAGYVIEEGDSAPIHHWLEVLSGDHWVPYDPVNGYERELPFNFVPARRGDERVVVARAAEVLNSGFTISRLPRAALESSAQGFELSDILDLTRLPLDMQRVLALVLLMPLGALVTCVFRNVIGLSTSGTFTPTLLALSFVFADWRAGLVILVTAVILGVATRYAIDLLKLLILPRLSIMLTLIVLCVVFGISALDHYRIAPGTNAVLLPMVIVTMLVERFYITTQEDGTRIAIQHLLGTAVVGFFCYLILRWEMVAQLLLAYPEAHCFTAAVLVLIGRYTGYQLFEPWRFRDFADPEGI
jgi:transglutaminase-like putative cysteine protease